MNDYLAPHEVLASVADAIPVDLRKDIIIVGSLAAAYQLLRDDDQSVRTKDVDGMVAPHAKAVVAATNVTNSLIDSGWTPKVNEGFELPSDEQTDAKNLPVVRLQPPNNAGWFLELLGAPSAIAPDEHGALRTAQRIRAKASHFELPSFAYLGVVQYMPTESEYQLRIATPQMMALANLLHHPEIGVTRMGASISGRKIKRSNKDLGRVVAMAHLMDLLNEDALEAWPQLWRDALQMYAPRNAEELLKIAPSGLHALAESYEDLDEALHSVNQGLLSQRPLTSFAFEIALKRLLNIVG